MHAYTYDSPLLPVELAGQIRVDPDTGCWLWIGHLDSARYGRIYSRDRAPELAHRKVYKLLRGPIPPYVVLDHCRLCPRQCRACVNPAHLDPVSIRTNAQRVIPHNRTKTHCPRGHSYAKCGVVYTGKDGYTRRYCAPCKRARDAARRVTAA